MAPNIEFNITELQIPRPDECIINGQYRLECLQKTLCEQLHNWQINTGIAVVVIYLLGGWLLWFYWRHINDKIDWEKIYAQNPYLLNGIYIKITPTFYIKLFKLGNMRSKDTQIYWDNYIRGITAKLMLGYIVILLYFALSH